MPERPFVWQMVKEAVEHLGNPTATYTAIREYIRGKYGDVNQSTMTCATVVCSVNHPSRVHYPENKKPRQCEGQYDFLYYVDRGTVELYHAARHGRWELAVDDYGKLVARQCGLIDPDPDDGTDGDGIDGLPFALECHLRDFLARNLNTVPIKGQTLKLYADQDSRDGVEYPTDVGPIDILAVDAAGNFFVLELKVNRGPDRTVGQTLRYMGWVTKHLAAGKKVNGVIVAGNIDEKLKYAASMVPNVSLLEYKLRFELSSVALS